MSAQTAHQRTAGLSLIALMALGFGAGLLNGLLGAAGGILLVALLPRLRPPAFLLSADVSPSPEPLGVHHDRRDILAAAMAVMIPVSLLSSFFYAMNGIRPDAGVLTALILPAILGGLIGAKLLGRLPEVLLRKLFAALVVVSGFRMLL